MKIVFIAIICLALVKDTISNQIICKKSCVGNFTLLEDDSNILCNPETLQGNTCQVDKKFGCLDFSIVYKREDGTLYKKNFKSCARDESYAAAENKDFTEILSDGDEITIVTQSSCDTNYCNA